MNAAQDIHTFRGRSLEEILPQIRAELGDDAVVVGRREVLEGGVGGFFAKREIEVQARAARPRYDVRDDEPALPEDEDAALPWEEEPAAEPAPADPFAEHLARLNAAPPPPAPAVEPHVSPQVSDAPTLDDVLPEPRLDLAALFGVGRPAPAEPEAAEPEPEPEAAEPEPEPEAAEPEPEAAEPEPEAAEPEPPVDAGPLAIVPAEPAAPRAPEPAVCTDAAPTGLDAHTPGAARPTAAAQALVAQGLSPRLAAEIDDEARTTLMPLARTSELDPLLRDALARRIPIAAPRHSGAGGVVGFVGPGGSGKTRCVARMATAFATRSELPVAVVTLRPKDGGTELQRLLAPVGVPIHAEDDAAAAAARVDHLREHALVLLDTPGVSPRAEAERRVLAAELAQLHPDELHVCIPATIAPGAGRVLAQAARDLGAGAMAITHADETDELGGVVELAIDAQLPIALVARGTSLESGLRPAAADDLALAVIP